MVSGEKAEVMTELGTEETVVESLSSPEESRAKAHVWAGGSEISPVMSNVTPSVETCLGTSA